MATTFHYITGKCKWAMVRTPDKEYNNYKINVYPDEQGLAEIESSGVRLEPRQDEDGTFYTFRRPVSKEIKGELIQFGPPKVVIAKDGAYVDFDGLVGNGSEVTVKVAVYDSKKGKGHRLEIVGVDNLVEYHGTNPADAMPAPREIQGMPPVEQPEEAPKKARKAPTRPW